MSDQDQSRLDQVERHIRQFFVGHDFMRDKISYGPMATLLPDFHVLCISPGQVFRGWCYATVGSSMFQREEGPLLEFFMLTRSEAPRQVDLLTAVAYYHSTEQLALGHTMPIGRPWIPNSSCDHLLISLPYLFGPELEICCFGQEHAHVLWVLPITRAERDFKAEHGLEALEQLFEKEPFDYLNPYRESVV